MEIKLTVNSDDFDDIIVSHLKESLALIEECTSSHPEDIKDKKKTAKAIKRVINFHSVPSEWIKL